MPPVTSSTSSPDWIDFEMIFGKFPSLAGLVLLPYQLLLLVAVVAMIRVASYNWSVSDLIRRSEKLHGATTEQLSPTMKETVSTWIVQHCKSTQFLQSMELSLLVDSFSIQRWWWWNSSINWWPLCDFWSRLSTDGRFRYRQRGIFLTSFIPLVLVGLAVSVQWHLVLLSSSLATQKRIQWRIIGRRGNC